MERRKTNSGVIELGTSGPPRILVIDSSQRILNRFKTKMPELGFKVKTSKKIGRVMAESFSGEPIDLVIANIDIHTESSNFKQAMEERGTPYLLMGPKDHEKANECMREGAEHYADRDNLNIDVLASHVQAILRRIQSPKADTKKKEILRFGNVVVNFNSKSLTVAGEDVHLARTEWCLLEYLTQWRGFVLTHDEIITKVWGPNYYQGRESLRVWISKLRGIIGPHIQNRAGIGYIFIDEIPHQASEIAEDEFSSGEELVAI